MNLSSLNIYGFQPIADLLEAALFSGEPVCLVGERGTAKTFLCRQLAKSIGIGDKFISYNASTINFEDVVGYPIPHKTEDGNWDRMDFIPTKSSIWGRKFVLLDELNRARIDRQNDLLQLIRNRSVQGIPVPELVWVWAAVNPLSYEGTSAMDEAMADRFSWIIRVPSFSQMTHDDRLEIIHNVTDDDMPGLQYWSGESVYEDVVATAESNIFSKISEAYKDIKDEFNEQIGEYVEQIILQMAKAGEGRLLIDGRRAGMLKRNILCLASVVKARTGELSLESVAAKAIFSSFPNELTGKPISTSKLQAAHMIAKDFLTSQEARDLIKVMAIEDDAKRIKAIFDYRLNPMDASNILSTYISSLDPSKRKIFSLSLLPKIMGQYEDKFTADILDQLAANFPSTGLYINVNELASSDELFLSLLTKGNFYPYTAALSGSTKHTSLADTARQMAYYMKEFKNIPSASSSLPEQEAPNGSV